MSDWVIRLIQQSGYLGVGFLMFLETIFPPIPSEVIMPVAGMAAAEVKMRFKTFFIASTIGTAGWTTLLATAGYKLRENFSDIDQYVGTASNAIIAVLVLGYV